MTEQNKFQTATAKGGPQVGGSNQQDRPSLVVPAHRSKRIQNIYISKGVYNTQNKLN